jgi:hypothetical protein
MVDYFFIILFIITSSIMIGFYIINIINKKLDNIQINKCKPCPTIVPKIIVNVCDKSKNKIDAMIKDTRIKDISNNSSNVKNIKTTDKVVEKFIVADANDFHNYDKHKKEALKESNTFDDEKIDNPLEKDKVDYDVDKDDKDFYIGMQYDFKPKKGTAAKKKDKKDKKLYFSNADFGWESPKQTVSCANSSISQQYKTGDKSLKPYQIDCNKPNLLTAENYWKTEHKIPIIPLEDHMVLGANYMDYTNWVEPTKIDFRLLSQTTKGLPENERHKSIPVGFSYGFHNTPAMRML